MKAAGRKSDDSAAAQQSTPPLTAPPRPDLAPASSESEDIAKLLRALNEDLKDDPADDLAGDDDEDIPESRGLPLGKIALALLAAAGIGAAVVLMGQDSPPAPGEPPLAAQLAAQLATQQSASSSIQAAAPTGQPTAANPPAALTRAPEALIARAPAIPPTPTAAAPPPPPPATALNPPPTLKAPEPPPLPPAIAAPPPAAPVQRTITQPLVPPQPAPTPAPTPAPVPTPPPAVAAAPPPPPPATVQPPAAVQPAVPPVTVTRAPEPLPPPAPAVATAPKAAEPAKTEPAKPAPVAKSEPGELQAMLAPKDAPKTTGRTPQRTKPDAPAAAGEAPPATIPDGRYAIQLGSFQQVSNAEALVGKLKANGFQAYAIDWTDSSQRSWRVVRVGGYPDQAAARRAGAEVKSKLGMESVVVSTR